MPKRCHTFIYFLISQDKRYRLGVRKNLLQSSLKPWPVLLRTWWCNLELVGLLVSQIFSDRDYLCKEIHLSFKNNTMPPGL